MTCFFFNIGCTQKDATLILKKTCWNFTCYLLGKTFMSKPTFLYKSKPQANHYI